MEEEKLSRRDFLKGTAALAGLTAVGSKIELAANGGAMDRPNILFVMTDQQRYDTIAELGNRLIATPNLDRLVRRGVTFTQAYSSCPVCVPARYTIRTGREPFNTGFYGNEPPAVLADQPQDMEERCGSFLGRVMTRLGYRTFGIGKFHAGYGGNLGYEKILFSEELYGTPEDRRLDAYAAFIAKEHPEYDWMEQPMGERTEMYYMPQMSHLPAELGVEAWAADRAVEEIKKPDHRPYFGFVSFIGPHPPFAPPQPFNRMYDPDRMPNPIGGDITLDHTDEQLPFMNYAIWAEAINDSHARVLKARYYGEISYIDQQIGRILDAVEAGPVPGNTLICFFSDHGDHLGDHHSWQKESFFEASCRVPFLVSWPHRFPRDVKRDELVCLTDLFGLATSAARVPEFRDGIDLLGVLERKAGGRTCLFGYYGTPGTPHFKVMARDKEWKYIFVANGGREQLFNVAQDPNELRQKLTNESAVADGLRKAALEALSVNRNAARALQGKSLKSFSYGARPLQRVYQMDRSRGVFGFPQKPEDLLRG